MLIAKKHNASEICPTIDRDESTAPDDDLFSVPISHAPITNVLTIDLEDWPIAVLGPRHAITSRVVENTRRLLKILSRYKNRATFFVLTKVAVKFPDLIREVHAAGHEIASHGHGHELLNHIGPRRFERDLRTSIEILTDLIGQRPIGYRAPAFSLMESTQWAVPIISNLGFKYSSSVFPIRHRRYGIPIAPRRIHRWSDSALIECPPATLRLMGRNLPVAGGGYFRLLPGIVTRTAIRKINREGLPAILYMHPYEIDVQGIRVHMLNGISVSPTRRITQSLFRCRIERRLCGLLENFRFTTLCDLLQYAR